MRVKESNSKAQRVKIEGERKQQQSTEDEN